MRNIKLLLIWFFVGVTITNCEVPKEPDFTTSHKVEAPILVNKEFQFLGGGGSTEALIDTTKGEFDSLFTIDPSNNFVSITQDEDFDFGDLNDAIPEISTDPTDFNSQVGELELGSFSSGDGNLGTASFQELTGLDPAFVPANTPIPGGTTPTPVNIDVGTNTDFFVSATIKEGAIEISVTNNLGFDISAIQVDLNSGDTFVATTTINDVNHGSTSSDQITFSNGDILSEINVDVSVSWNAQNTQATPGDLVVENINGVGLIASEVEAALESQDFSTSNTSDFDDTEFTFTDPAHYVELKSGTINIASIVNGLDLTIDSLVISFPSIRQGPNFLPEDSLVIRYVAGLDQIVRSSSSGAKSRDLSGYRIFALNNEISYNISAVTENTQDAAIGDQTRVINENDEISSSVEIIDLKIATAFGNIAEQSTLLGDDDASNGTDVVDLFNDTEAELTEISGLEDISSQIEGIEFTQASLSILYESNITVPTTVYAAFVGINGDGEEVFLSGKDISMIVAPGVDDVEVKDGDPIGGILSNGRQLLPEEMIKFELTPSLSGDLESQEVLFGPENSTINEFLNNLPNEIRFVGKSVVNEGGGAATISTPLEFDPMISINLPLAFRTTSETIFTDTTEVSDLSDLPKPEDDTNLTEGVLLIDYENGLPIGFGLKLVFIREDGSTVTSLPLGAGETYDLLGSSVDQVTRFADIPTSGNIQIALTDEQLSLLHEATSIIIESNLRTTENSEVKFRTTDSIKLSISAKFSFENKF